MNGKKVISAKTKKKLLLGSDKNRVGRMIGITQCGSYIKYELMALLKILKAYMYGGTISLLIFRPKNTFYIAPLANTFEN